MTFHGEYNQEKGHKRSRNRRVHLKNKLKLRYGIEVTNSDLKNLVKIIKSKKVFAEKTISDGCQIYTIQYRNQLVRLLYDPYRKELITALNLLDHQKQQMVN